MVDETVSDHGPVEGPPDEVRNRVSQVRPPLSQNRTCEKYWTLPTDDVRRLKQLEFENAARGRESVPATLRAHSIFGD